MAIKRLTEELNKTACTELAAIDPDLGRIIDRYGYPPLWDREPGFATLVHIILEQQVSLASAVAALNKLKEMIGDVTPENVARLDDAELRHCYFSKQKSAYVRGLANEIIGCRFNLERISELSDAEARSELKMIKGIGDWTADIYLLMALLRPDVMPKGDLALHLAYRNLKRLENAPHSDEFQVIAERWRPYRASAARLLWHFYLSSKKDQRSR